ncbi:polysaccharide biosynthesis protein [Sphingobacterium lactis]|uniref:NDP-sugar epimerase, includes UDP-GlcNAc-inverting 4,6-dehydratase FlaA1 and capsular polysaccharide biosynthesis protein EpsC n=2 Tax=Sphingobacterium lactis TaxID=797291 RepID=A0A1H5VBJ6_9SPHI|nr:nucleoside-diphosphate sugar epimerase/dehydratase [Sphingobacterium lactis]SEF84679.1 NDP-sugar epimerase, includes UDP-GlcNAc-inverting 4,6-dehydratase FlaA1 and capsular polysaccharide biosynthesis protein EpsC [Sphingobacterium lactis]
MKIIKPLNNIKIVPRWIIFTFDIAVSAIAFFFAYVLCYNFQLDSFTNESFAIDFLFCIGLTALSFMIFRLYSGIVRYTSAVDSIRILSTIVFTSITMFIAKLAFIAFSINISIPTNLIITYALFAFTGLTTYRTCIKIFFQYTKSTRNGRKNAIVYGAGDLGIAVKRTFEHDFRADKTIVAYMDDSEEKIGKVIDGLKIFSSKDFQRIVRKYGVDELIIASTRIDIETKNLVVEQALELNVNVLTLPPVHKIINGDLSPAQIKQVKIEDLLERAPIQISNMKLLDQLRGKRVLVTGAAGSIGSEISKQLGKYEPQMIILCDQAESPLHNLQLDLQDQFKNQIYHTFIADIRSQERMRLLFETFKPHFVYHAAAYKHVPMMENHPSEGVKTNVFGTYQLANLAVEFDVQKFVFVSTDKAVNPTNVMGATKRIAEKYVQSLNNYLTSVNGIKSTKFITTRFGNVLGSNGSVIPRFKDQIEKGGPVTVTHPDITRYFMTIPEACQLVIEAGNMGNGGEIFVFDMGKSVKIVDLAKKMIRLSGFTPFKDIDIKFTGLRPGEKLYEELLNDLENTLPTHHEKIMIAKVRNNDFELVKSELNTLGKELESNNNVNIVRQMKVMVPEFKSQNSIYEQLDKEIMATINP